MINIFKNSKNLRALCVALSVASTVLLSSCQNPFSKSPTASTLESTNSKGKAILNTDLSIVSTSTSTATADGTLVNLNVTLLDAQGTPVSKKLVTITSSRGSDDTITAIQATTDSSGHATFTVQSYKTGTSTYTASLGSGGTGTLSQKPTVAYTPGPATKLVFSAQPSSAIAGTTFGTQPVVLLQDQYGNCRVGRDR